MARRRTTAVSTVLIANPSAELYGSDRVMLETVRGLRAEGVKVIVSVPGAGPLEHEIRACGGEVMRCPTPVARKSALRPRGAVRLIGDLTRGFPAGLLLIRRARPDVVLVNTLTIPLWLVLALVTRKRVVCHVHEAEQSAGRWVQRLLTAPLLLADQLIVNSQFSLDVLAASFPALRRKATVIYNGIPGPDRPTRARLELVGPLRLLYIGRLSPRKGPAVALEALSLLRDRGVDARLDLVGSAFRGYEWFAAELADAVERDPMLRGRVTFHGFVGDVWPQLAASDIVVVPSRVDEPFGNTAVEAMLAARPAVVSATSGLLEAARGYRSVRSVEPGSAIEIAQAVCDLTATWPRAIEDALVDSATARSRHAPSHFQSEIADVLIVHPVRRLVAQDAR